MGDPLTTALPCWHDRTLPPLTTGKATLPVARRSGEEIAIAVPDRFRTQARIGIEAPKTRYTILGFLSTVGPTPDVLNAFPRNSEIPVQRFPADPKIPCDLGFRFPGRHSCTQTDRLFIR